MTESNDRPASQQPPPSIVHIMAWTMGTAFILVFYKFVNRLYGDDLPESIRLTLNSQYIANSFLRGASLACLGIFIARRIRGGAPMPVEPGHWMLLNGAVTTLLMLCYYIIASPFWIFGLMAWWATGVIYIPSIILLVLALRSRRSFRLWKVYFAFAILQSVFPFVMQLSMRYIPVSFIGNFSIVLQFLPMLILLAAVIDDKLNSVKRDWIHWVGVVVNFASVFLSTLLSILLPSFV